MYNENSENNRRELKNWYNSLPVELNDSINTLVSAYHSGKRPLDCELSQVRGDINASESYKMIDSGLAKELRQRYFYDFLEGKYGEVL